ncbi:MBL fold metallo-hydrolase [Alteribacillus sp. HJP-4]
MGRFHLTSISDGAFPVTKNFFFANTPSHIVSHIPNHYHAPLNVLLIDTGTQKILIDAGLGSTFAPVAGKLVDHLKTIHVSPGDIQTVIITHGHLDHIGGLIHSKRPVFPQAQYVLSQEEWDVWESDPSSQEHNILLLLKNCLTLLPKDAEVFPGVRIIHTPGHTAGHLCVHVNSENNDLLIASDILNDPATLQHLPSHISAEMSPAKGLNTRRKFLKKAHDMSAMVFACHYPFPGLGYINKRKEKWIWVPHEL